VKPVAASGGEIFWEVLELTLKLADPTAGFEPTERWGTTDANELYDITSWGKGYFSFTRARKHIGSWTLKSWWTSW
jgi:hypothetical protein